MHPHLIVMLTYNDKTVENALELFESMKDTPVKYWGFKDVGLSRAEMIELVEAMKAAGKTVKLEVVSITEEKGLEAAKLAAEVGIDVLMGTVYYDSINEYLQGTSVKYVPFAGKVYGHPSILDGEVDEVAEHAYLLESKGVDGIDLLTHRYTGNAELLLNEVVDTTKLRVVSAGSIDSFDRIREVSDAGAWAFTIGTAFFEKKFVPDGSFRDNMMAVWDRLHDTPQC
ncbi:hypothetical protein ACFL67_03165 [candidate division KSB1 bacterium]